MRGRLALTGPAPERLPVTRSGTRSWTESVVALSCCFSVPSSQAVSESGRVCVPSFSSWCVSAPHIWTFVTYTNSTSICAS